MIAPVFDDGELAFRAEVDAFFAATPRDCRGFYAGRGGATRELYRRMGERGWLSLCWPEVVGGRGLPPSYEYLLWDAAAYHRAARPDLGPGIVAHVLVAHGTREQQERHLPRLASGTACFALGYSEPEAGSDLTALRTRAARDGEAYVVTGEKCWTSDAHHADLLWLLCRTGELAERSRGLTLLMVDLDSDGVEIGPIETIDGHRLNVVHLDGVVVPAEDRVGAEGAAWSIIRDALAVERHLQLLPGRVRRDLDDLRASCHQAGIAGGHSVRSTLAELSARFAQVEASSLRTVAELCAGRPAVAEAARTKLLGTRLAQDLPRTALELLGPAALDADGIHAFLWRQTFMETIGGGTSEVMLSILAREALGLGARS